MRFLLAILVLLLVLGTVSGCASSRYSFFNGSHLARHFTFIYHDLDNLHVDIDRVLLGIEEHEPPSPVAAD